MKTCIVGAGAIGGFIGARLAAAQACELSAYARGATLAALHEHGWRLQENDSLLTAPARASDDAAALGPQDLVIIAVKGQALAAVARQIGPLIGPDTIILPAMNGVPWWFGQGVAAIGDAPLASVDPGSVIAAALPYRQVLGCVVHASTSTPAAWGVRRVFGYPGDGINGVVTAFDACERRMEFVQARHEELAAFMATARTPSSPARSASAWPPRGRARSTCSTACTTPRPTTSRWWPSSASRRACARRRLPAGGRPAVAVQGRRPRVRADHDGAGQVRHLVDRAVRIARDQRTVTCVILPQRRAGGGGGDAAARARHGAQRHRHHGESRCPTRRTCRPRPTSSTPASVAILAGAGALARDRRTDRGRRTAGRRRRQGAARQGVPCRTTCPSSPAPSACSAPQASWDLMKGATRC
jgi:hypothetical protein